MRRDLTADAAEYRRIASDWHGGQWSPLYAYSSSGSIVPGLCAEIRRCIRGVEEEPSHYSNPFAEAFRLGRLLGHVAPMEDEDG